MLSYILPFVGAMYVEKCQEGGIEGFDYKKMQGEWYLTQVDEDAFMGYEPMCHKIEWRDLELQKAKNIESKGQKNQGSRRGQKQNG